MSNNEEGYIEISIKSVRPRWDRRGVERDEYIHRHSNNPEKLVDLMDYVIKPAVLAMGYSEQLWNDYYGE